MWPREFAAKERENAEYKELLGLELVSLVSKIDRLRLCGHVECRWCCLGHYDACNHKLTTGSQIMEFPMQTKLIFI